MSIIPVGKALYFLCRLAVGLLSLALVYNVLSDNREVKTPRNLIRDNDPDIILLSEPTQWWLEQLDGLEDDYPYTLFQPQENHYGLLLYSKLELENPEIRFLIEPEIPSIRTKLRLRSGTVVTLYGVHPRPPGLQPPNEGKDSGIEEDEEDQDEDGEREDSDMRDAELLSVAKEVKGSWTEFVGNNGRIHDRKPAKLRNWSNSQPRWTLGKILGPC